MENDNNFNQDFYNPEIEFNEKYSSEIHMHKIMRGTRKCDIIIQGLIFKLPEENKTFIKTVSTKFGIGGCLKNMDDYDDKNKVFVFTGDKRDAIRDLLINTYKRDIELIKYHG